MKRTYAKTGRTSPVTNTIPTPSYPPPCTALCTLEEQEMQDQASAASSLLEEGEKQGSPQ